MVNNTTVFVRKDYQGSDLTIGTTVIFMEVNYRNFVTGILTKMSDKKGTIIRENGKKSVQFYSQMIRANHG